MPEHNTDQKACPESVDVSRRSGLLRRFSPRRGSRRFLQPAALLLFVGAHTALVGLQRVGIECG